MTTPPITSITDELIEELETAAKAATPGLWRYETDEDSCFGAVFVTPDTVQYSPPICRIDDDCTAEYVAFASPSTILGLLSRIADLKQQLVAAGITAENCEMFRKDAERFHKLLRWMSSNVAEGWSEVERVGAVAAYMGHSDAMIYIDDLPECNVGLSGSAT